MIDSFTRWLNRPSRIASRPERRRVSPVRLQLESLEDREVPAASVFVVPQGAPTDATHFANLSAALTAAGDGGTVTIQAGAQQDNSAVNVTQANVTIRGDNLQSAYFMPLFNLNVAANGIILQNLNLQSVTIGANNGGLQLLNSTVNTVTQTTGGTPLGGNVLQYNRILGSVSLVGGATAAADLIAWNVFTGTGAEGGLGGATAMLNLTDESGVQVIGNRMGNGGTFGPSGALGQKAGGFNDTRAAAILAPAPGQASSLSGISFTSTGTTAITGAVIQGNTITINADAATDFGISVVTGAQSVGLSILGNAITTGTGTGLSIDAGSDTATQVLVQGNNFNGNAIGVDYDGNGGTTIATDLGGGSLGSIGGNIFASFTSAATATNAAISVTGVGAGAVLNAARNVFGVANTALVVTDPATTNTGSPLTGNLGFVQYLYVSLLGRAGSSGEIQAWANAISNGQLTRTAAQNQILYSTESLGRILNLLYVDCLGRTIDSTGQTNATGFIQNGGSLEAVIVGVVSSVEWQQKNPGNPIEVYYENQLRRVPTAAELAGWQAFMANNGGLPAVATGFVGSQELRTYFGLTVLSQIVQNPSASAQATALAGNNAINLLGIASNLITNASYPTV